MRTCLGFGLKSCAPRSLSELTSCPCHGLRPLTWQDVQVRMKRDARLPSGSLHIAALASLPLSQPLRSL